MEVEVNDLGLIDPVQFQYHGIDPQEMQLPMMKILLQHKWVYFDRALVWTDA